jgi:hypothetical protein
MTYKTILFIQEFPYVYLSLLLQSLAPVLFLHFYKSELLNKNLTLKQKHGLPWYTFTEV